MAYEDFLKRLHEEEWFQRFLKDVMVPGVPGVPPFNPTEDNSERWKYDSGMREGYKVALHKLGVKVQ